MKSILFSLLFILVSLNAQAQITVTSATFPAVGDTLRYAQANNQNLPNMLTPPGGNQFWDFSALSPNEFFKTIYRPAIQGQNAAQFPGAEMGVFTPASEQYYNLTNTKFELMGYTSSTLFNYNVNALYKYEPPYIERQAPLNFFDIHQQAQNLTNAFAITDLPAALVASLPMIQSLDSIRLRINRQTLDVVDGWGILTIPGPIPQPQYQVLRQKRTEYVTTALDAHIIILGWVDISFFAATELSNYLGTDTTVYHRFLNDVAKEEIAVLTISNDGSEVQSVRYKNNKITTSVTDKPAPDAAAIQAFPNPAVDQLRFECTNLPAGAYALRLFDGVGRAVWSNSYLLSGNQSIFVDIRQFEKGIYFYRLEDLKGRLVGANRLVIGQD